MGRVRYARGFWWALALLLVAGCCTSKPGMYITDTVAEGPKGYVEFYHGPKGIFRYVWGGTIWRAAYVAEIYERHLGKDTCLGDVARPTIYAESGMYWRRIAASPGPHTYVVKIGSDEGVVSVDVQGGMIVPIRLDIRTTRIEGLGAAVERAEFEWSINQRKTFPFNDDPESLRALIEHLKSQDWEDRWYAACILGNLNAETAVEDLRKLSVGDPDPDVRAAAETALTEIR